MTENPVVRPSSSMPPLLQRLSELKPESLDYLGVSYGLTPQLLTYVKVPSFLEWLHLCQAFRFWKRAGFVPLYIRQTASELTGEHTCVMVRGTGSSAERELEWLGEFAKGAGRFTPPLCYVYFWLRFSATLYTTSIIQVPRIWQCYSSEHP